MINITLQFPPDGPDGNPISGQDVRDWAEAVKRAVLGFNGISITILEIVAVRQVHDNGKHGR